MQYYFITIDIWSATRTITLYMAVTVHYIDAEWRLQSHCLQTAFVPEDHTAENLATGLQKVLESWALPESRLAHVTTDNGSNIVTVIRMCAISSPSEKVFSTNGNIITSKHSCLKLDKVDKLVFSKEFVSL